MGNDRTLSHDPVRLDEVHRSLGEADYFQNASRFHLKSGEKLDDFRDYVERDAERFLHSEEKRNELKRARLHGIDPDEIVREAEEKIDWLHGMGALSDGEAGDFWNRVSGPQFRSKFDEIRQRDSERLTGGRPEERHKLIWIRQLLWRFEEFTTLSKWKTWLEIAGLFLIFEASDVSCSPAPKTQRQQRDKVYRPRNVKGVWKIEETVGCSIGKDCEHFYARVCGVLNNEGCVKLANSLRRVWQRWPDRHKSPNQRWTK